MQYEPEQVYFYLKDEEHYRVEPMLELCRQSQLADATAWLLERMGEFHQAFSLINEVLRGCLWEDCLQAKGEGGSGGKRGRERGVCLMEASSG